MAVAQIEFGGEPVDGDGMDRWTAAFAFVAVVLIGGVGYAIESEQPIYPDDRIEHVVIYEPDWSDIVYRVAVADDPDLLYDTESEQFLVTIPFGMPPGDGRLRLLDQADARYVAEQPISAVTWPLECLGSTPDKDQDGLLDNCDPYPEDVSGLAPLAVPVARVNIPDAVASWCEQRDQVEAGILSPAQWWRNTPGDFGLSDREEDRILSFVARLSTPLPNPFPAYEFHVTQSDLDAFEFHALATPIYYSNLSCPNTD